MTIDEKLRLLRDTMKARGVDALIVPSQDPHQSEYPATRYEGRRWISGFTGSAGTVVVTRDFAGVWTDGRYFIQAVEELRGTDFEMRKLEGASPVEYLSWLTQNLTVGSTVSIDGQVCSVNQYRRISSHLKDSGISLRTDIDLIGMIWKDRPSWPQSQIFAHQVEYAGATRSEKLRAIRDQMRTKGADSHFVVPLDAIAWTLNLRGSDVSFNPVFVAYLLIDMEGADFFVHEGKLSQELENQLAQDNIRVHSYEKLEEHLTKVPENQVLWHDPSHTNMTCAPLIESRRNIEGDTIPMNLKAIKNATEIGHVEKTMAKDGVAILRTMNWLEARLEKGQNTTEYELGERLAHERAQMPHYVGESFNPIVGYRSNGAIIHYRATEEGAATIGREGLLLVDSGGQYLDGTTDITRTFHLGNPTAEEKRLYTLVLKGHINLARARFPRGTRGIQLDTLARIPLWRAGLNFQHGTGHGVGFFMNVHEPPQGFANNLSLRGKIAHEPGMLSSNEPGFYLPGQLGIRIENLVVCEEDADGFLSLRDLTLYPMERTLIDLSMLHSEEIAWLDDYHQMVYERMAPLCTAEEREKLESLCMPMV